MAEGPVFERNLGSDGSHGINFEWETTLLTYLRCEKLHQHWKKNNDTGVKSFFVANNVKGVGAFDDVVVRVVYVLEGDKISDFKQNTKQCDFKKHGEEIETQMKLKSLFNCTFEECELLFLSNIESLPKNTDMLGKIMGFLELKKSSEKELKHYRQKLKLSSKDAKMEISEKLSGSWINIPSRFQKIEKMKIFRTLIDLGYENVCLILNDKEDVEKLELARRSQTYMQEKTNIYATSLKRYKIYTCGTQSTSLDDKIVDEEYLVNYNGEQKIAILNDIAGMGKSTTMLALAMSEDIICNPAEATHFVATKLLNLKGIEYDMFINACFVTGRVAIFFDAYDELSEPELESTNIARIIVSSRPKCAYDLEKIFLIKSFEFLELLSVERERCLFEYWKKMMNCEVEDEQHLKQIVNKIICSLETKANILNELLATPLQIKMISKAYFKTMTCVYKNEVENTCIEIDVINLYDKYVHSHVEHYFEVKFGGNWTNWDKEKRDREIQGKLKGALEFGCGIVVPDLEIQILNRDNVLQALHNDLGLITNMDPPVFIHRTVSEYLAAKYIVTEGKSYPKYFENIVMNVNILRKWIPDETALHVAASEGNSELLKALLQCESILIDIRNNNGSTSFHIACLSGNTEAAKILLSTKNCSVDTVDRYGNSPLHDATKNGSVEIIERILRVNISDLETNQSSFQKVFSKQCTEKSKLINCQNKDGYTSMHLAVQLNLVEAVKLLLEDHLFNMNILDKDDNSVFHWAARTGSIKIMQLFLEYNETQHNITTENTSLHIADSKRKIVAKILNQKNKYDQTPLHLAVYYGHIDAVEFLIKHNCSLNERDNNGESVLHLATERKHIKIMTMLLHCDPTLIHQRNNQQKIPLHTACYLGCTEAVELLIKYNCSVKERDRFGKTALHMAVNGNYVDTLEKLLQKDCSSINQKNAFGETAFLYACACGSTDAVELLIKYNCSMNDQDMNGNTALHVAAKENRVQIINQILLKCHPSFVNQKNSAGNTAMYFACLHGANDAVELLIKHDSSVNERDRYGDTLLHLATEKNHVKIMENLLKHSPSLLNLQNNNGESALHLACNKSHTDAVKFLLANECAVDTTDRGNKTALHHASKWGRRNIVVLLLENNCSIIDLKDGGNKTALNYASQSGYVEIEKILKEKGASNGNYTQRCIIL
ncbi:hypothetical protein B566_EDAN008824 [Ephemera danica]|nr:hypothetical protein B566_EDAN008824 [Ephemera danica]